MLCKTRDCGLDSMTWREKMFGFGLMEEQQRKQKNFGLPGNLLIAETTKIAEKLDIETIILSMMWTATLNFTVYAKKDCIEHVQVIS